MQEDIAVTYNSKHRQIKVFGKLCTTHYEHTENACTKENANTGITEFMR